MKKRCTYCGRYFVPDRRIGNRQKACGLAGCKRKRKQEAQRRWLEKNPGYFEGRYDYVKEWRRKKNVSPQHSSKMIQDKIPPSESMQTYVLLIPAAKTGVIQDEIILRRLGGSTFAAYG